MAEAIIDLLGLGWAGADWYGAAIVVVVVVIRWLRKPLVQRVLGWISPVLLWASWPGWVRKVAILLGSLSTSLLASLGAGQTWTAALAAALPVALGAVVAHKATKMVGHGLTHSALAKDLAAYRPGSLRTSLDVLGLLPLNHKALGPLPAAADK